eukprot:scaffold110730_cov19-Tisochrysis_lutea.AAC.4
MHAFSRAQRWALRPVGAEQAPEGPAALRSSLARMLACASVRTQAGGHFGLRGPSSSNSRDGYRSRAAAAAQAGGLVTDADGSSAVPLRAAPSKPLPT